jgi:hypothetical protein
VADGPRPWLITVTMDFVSAEATPLSEEAKQVFLALEGFARNKPYCWPGNSRLEQIAGKKGRALRVLYSELERGGWITRVRSTDGKKKRDGFILRRRANPSMPAAGTAEAVAEAKAAIFRDMPGGSNRQKTAKSSRQNFAAEEAAAAQQQAAAKGSPS